MTLDEILRDLHALREDLQVFERTHNMPTEVHFQAYSSGEEPANTAWVLDWSEWAATYRLLEERLYDSQPHPDEPTLANSDPHHKHVPPDIKHNRLLAPGLGFDAPNLPFLIAEIESLIISD